MYIYFSITISCNFYPRSVPFLVFKLLYFYYYFLLIFFLSFILNIVLLSCKCDTSCKSNPRYKNVLSWTKSRTKKSLCIIVYSCKSDGVQFCPVVQKCLRSKVTIFIFLLVLVFLICFRLLFLPLTLSQKLFFQ